MMSMSRVALAGVFAIGLATAAEASPQVPTFSDPYPANPIATDGTPLLRPTYDSPLYSGRSVGYGPVGDLVGGGVGLAGGAVDAGLGVAGSALDFGVGTADDVVP